MQSVPKPQISREVAPAHDVVGTHAFPLYNCRVEVVSTNDARIYAAQEIEAESLMVNGRYEEAQNTASAAVDPDSIYYLAFPSYSDGDPMDLSGIGSVVLPSPTGNRTLGSVAAMPSVQEEHGVDSVEATYSAFQRAAGIPDTSKVLDLGIIDGRIPHRATGVKPRQALISVVTAITLDLLEASTRNELTHCTSVADENLNQLLKGWGFPVRNMFEGKMASSGSVVLNSASMQPFWLSIEDLMQAVHAPQTPYFRYVRGVAVPQNSSEQVRQRISAMGEMSPRASISVPRDVDESIDRAPKIEEGKSEFTLRSATHDDLDKMVALDMKAFESVYMGYGLSEEVLRRDLYSKFEARLNKVGSRWVSVVEDDGEICGFMMSCPTTKIPEDFVSWEETTDNGTLETTYDPNGDYVYVVSLTMPRPEGGDSPKNMLIADQIGKMIQGGYQCAYFESRLPGLSEWVPKACEEKGIDVATLSDHEVTLLAEEYATTRIERNGKSVLLDHHLRMYEAIGCKFLSVVPNAYQDGPSLNHGVVTVLESPLSKRARTIKPLGYMAGKLLQKAARSHKITKRLF